MQEGEGGVFKPQEEREFLDLIFGFYNADPFKPFTVETFEDTFPILERHYLAISTNGDLLCVISAWNDVNPDAFHLVYPPRILSVREGVEYPKAWRKLRKLRDTPGQ